MLPLSIDNSIIISVYLFQLIYQARNDQQLYMFGVLITHAVASCLQTGPLCFPLGS